MEELKQRLFIEDWYVLYHLGNQKTFNYFIQTELWFFDVAYPKINEKVRILNNLETG